MDQIDIPIITFLPSFSLIKNLISLLHLILNHLFIICVNLIIILIIKSFDLVDLIIGSFTI